MADEETPTTEEPAKKGLPIKLLIIIGIVMAVEGAVIFGVVKIFGDSKPAAMAEGLESDPQAEELKLVEVLLVGDKFQNTRQGAQAYLYDSMIYVLVRKRDQAYIEGVIEERKARINASITEIIARAEPATLNDPEHNTIKRHILEQCQTIFGRVPGGGAPPAESDEDAEARKTKVRDQSNDDYYVVDVVISGWKRISIDG